MKNKKLFPLAMAAVMGVSLFAGCGQTGESSVESVSGGQTTETGTQSGEPTEIIWMVRNEEPKNFDSVMAAVNEKLLKEKNMTLDMRFIAPGDYDTKMQMAMAGGDEWDLCFTSHWANNYVNAAGKGAYLELSEEMLNENAPNLMATIPENLWNGVKVNGNIYALMNYQAMYDQAGMMFLKSAVDEQGIDVTTVNSWESLNKTIADLAAAYPDKYATRGGGVINHDLMLQDVPLSTIMNMPFLTYDPETNKVSNTLYFDRIQENLASAKEWKDKNYAPADAATIKDEKTLLSQGQILSRYQRVKPGVDTALKNTYGNEWVTVPMGDPYINTMAVQSTLTAVNVNSEHPEEAIQLYDYIFGDKEISNMLFYGLEGQDYELVNGRVKKLEDCWSAPAWMLGNQFNALLLEADVEGVWEETMKGNEEATLDPLFGFVPDRSSIETEMANCEAIWTEYKDILYYGLQDQSVAVPEMLDKMNKAGLEKVTAEIQNQVDEFLASKA